MACCGYGGAPLNFDSRVTCGPTKVLNGNSVTAKGCNDSSEYVNWDGIHYTKAATQFVSTQILAGKYSDPFFTDKMPFLLKLKFRFYKNNIIISSATWTPSPCPICLGPFVQESYLDNCFYKFCFNCILRWTKVVSHKLSFPPSSIKCPLCKTEFFSIVHGYDGITFQRHYINEDVGNSAFFSEAHKYRLQCYYVESDDTLTNQFNVSRYWKSRKYLQQNHWLQSWLRREIQALLQEEDVEIIVYHILGIVDSFRSESTTRISSEASRENMKTSVSLAATPFIVGRTNRFVNEVELFLASGLNIEAYDKVYIHHFGTKQNPNEDGVIIEHEPVVTQLHFFDGDSVEAE